MQDLYFSSATHKKGFSLVEAAIVLGVVGLVIGGIWVAASAVQSTYKNNEVATAVLQLSKGIQSKVSFATYPSTNNTQVSLTSMAYYSQILPSAQLKGTELVLPYGIYMRANASCYSATYPSSGCPMLSIQVLGPTYGSLGKHWSAADCIQTIRKFAGLMKNQSEDLLYIQIVDSSIVSSYLYPPIDGASVSCPTDLYYVVFWFRPGQS